MSPMFRAILEVDTVSRCKLVVVRISSALMLKSVKPLKGLAQLMLTS